MTFICVRCKKPLLYYFEFDGKKYCFDHVPEQLVLSMCDKK